MRFKLFEYKDPITGYTFGLKFEEGPKTLSEMTGALAGMKKVQAEIEEEIRTAAK